MQVSYLQMKFAGQVPHGSASVSVSPSVPSVTPTVLVPPVEVSPVSVWLAWEALPSVLVGTVVVGGSPVGSAAVPVPVPVPAVTPVSLAWVPSPPPPSSPQANERPANRPMTARTLRCLRTTIKPPPKRPG